MPDTVTIKTLAAIGGKADSAVASAEYTTIPGTGTWTNPAGGSWATATNWLGNFIPNAGDLTADFGTLNLAADATVTLDGPITIANLVFANQNATKHAWTISGDPGAGEYLTLVTTGTTPVIDTQVDATLDDVDLLGTSGVTKTGPGTLTMAGDASLGNLDIQDGAVILDGGSYTSTNTNGGWGLWLRNTTDSSLTVTNDAVVTIARGFQVQQGTATIESGSITADGHALSQIYVGNSTTDATLNILGGTVTTRVMSFGNSGSNATLNLEGGNLIWNTAPTIGSGTATLNMGGGTLTAGGDLTVPSSLPFTLTGTNGPLTIDTNGPTMTLANDLTSSGGLTKTGTGTLTLAGLNDYTGPTTVTGGCLLIDWPDSIPSDGTGTVVETGAEFGFVAGMLLDSEAVTVANNVTWSGGSLVFHVAFGDTQSFAGDLTGGNFDTSGAAILVKGGGTLDFTGASLPVTPTSDDGSIIIGIGGSPAIEITSISRTGTTAEIAFTVTGGGNVDVYKSLDLVDFTSLGSPYATDQTSPYQDTSATQDKAFYLLVPTGDPAP